MYIRTWQGAYTSSHSTKVIYFLSSKTFPCRFMSLASLSLSVTHHILTYSSPHEWKAASCWIPGNISFTCLFCKFLHSACWKSIGNLHRVSPAAQSQCFCGAVTQWGTAWTALSGSCWLFSARRCEREEREDYGNGTAMRKRVHMSLR